MRYNYHREESSIVSSRPGHQQPGTVTGTQQRDSILPAVYSWQWSSTRRSPEHWRSTYPEWVFYHWRESYWRTHFFMASSLDKHV